MTTNEKIIRDTYRALGAQHARFRPLQALILYTAAEARLAELLVANNELTHLDALVRRLDLLNTATVAARKLKEPDSVWLDAYINGFNESLQTHGMPWELHCLCTKLPHASRERIISGFLLSSYLGLAEGQERMEQALCETLRAGASPQLLQQMFSPHLERLPHERIKTLSFSPSLGTPHFGFSGTSGSNTWAISGKYTASGKPMLCGDPHLQINQLPNLFFEINLPCGDNYWLGATIPGLPGIAVGRNRHLAWSGTFSCADNVDFTIEEINDGLAMRETVPFNIVYQDVVIKRRFRKNLRLRLGQTDHGSFFSSPQATNQTPVSRWAGRHAPEQSLAAWLYLPTATSAKQAETILDNARNFSLHFVLADTGGDVRYCQLGRVPKRSHGWTGLHPVWAREHQGWQGFYEGIELPRFQEDIVVSANEARTTNGGAHLSTLAQPNYRYEQIFSRLRENQQHAVDSMKSIQTDTYSLQAKRHVVLFLQLLEDCPIRSALVNWNFFCDVESQGAYAFALVYRTLIRSLSPELGGDHFIYLFEHTELPVWWFAAFERLLDEYGQWPTARKLRAQHALKSLTHQSVYTLGDWQQFSMHHFLWGPLGKWLGASRGPFALPGSIATVSQGNIFLQGTKQIAIGPAYRFICNLAEPGAYSSFPGGIHGSIWQRDYDVYIPDWLNGQYHALKPLF